MVNDRIGVYICHCGGNISDVVDVYKVVEAVKDMPEVAVAREYMFMCSDPGQKLIEDDIKNYNLNGVVVASCSPHLHELTFRGAVQRGGLNPYLFEQINIREHSAWVHKHEPEAATEKAIRLVRSGIAKVSLARELSTIRVDMEPKVLVVGAGIAGIRAALDLAKADVEVYLVEKQPFIGGRVAQGYGAYPSGRMGSEIIKELIEELKKEESKIKLFTNAEIKSLGGTIGKFHVVVQVNPRYVVGNCSNFNDAIEKCPIEVPDEFNYGLTKRKAIYYPYEGAYPELPVIDMENCNKCGECVKICGGAINLEQEAETVEFDVSTIVLATGFNPYEPKEGEFGYKQFEGVITLPVFERLMALSNGKLTYNGKEVKEIAFIYCVGSREKDGEHEYCSRYCCTATLNASLAALEKYNDLRIYHIYRDIRAYGKYERYYEEAGKKGELFLRYVPEEPPVVEKEGDKLIVKVKDQLTFGEEIELPVDMVVLSVGMEPRNEDVFQMLRVPFSRDGFLQEIHPKIRPVETAIGGVLICGTCQAPRDTVETTASASAVAAKTETYTLKGYTELEPFIAEVDAEKCTGCGDCVPECPTEAIELKEVAGGEKKAFINEVLCIGCGACGGICPEEAINLRGYRYDQLRKMIDAMVEEV